MHTIFCIDENTQEANHTVRFAFELASKIRARLVLGTVKPVVSSEAIVLSAMSVRNMAPALDQGISGRLWPEITGGQHLDTNMIFAGTIDISGWLADEFVQFVNQHGVSILVMSAAAADTHIANSVEKILHKVLSPVLLIPPEPTNIPSKLAYLTDLRYCRLDLLNRTLQLTTELQTTVSVAHLSLPGLPDLAPAFALDLFNEICQKCPYGQRLTFHHIPDQPIVTVADVLVYRMQHDGLVLANHTPHFGSLIKERLLAENPNSPHPALLLYPG
jgi:hypothetical protein